MGIAKSRITEQNQSKSNKKRNNILQIIQLN